MADADLHQRRPTLKHTDFFVIEIVRRVYKVTDYAFSAIHSVLPISNRLIVRKKDPIHIK